MKPIAEGRLLRPKKTAYFALDSWQPVRITAGEPIIRQRPGPYGYMTAPTASQTFSFWISPVQAHAKPNQPPQELDTTDSYAFFCYLLRFLKELEAFVGQSPLSKRGDRHLCVTGIGRSVAAGVLKKGTLFST
jgi:hypothetical protein